MSFEAFILLTLPTATLNISHQSHSGPFELKCVSLVVEGGKDMQGNNPPSHQEIYLVIRVHGHDTPIDPSRPITLSSNNHGRSYVFGTADEGTGSLLLRTPAPHEVMTLEDQNTLHGILAQYADLKESDWSSQMGQVPDQTVSHEATRGRLILVDDSTGEVVGELDHRLPIREDPTLGIPGTEAAPVVIEIADDDAQEIFARAIPPEDRDWITNSASLVSRVISGSTKFLLTTVTSATDSFIANSTPHTRTPSTNGASAPAPASALPQALIFLTSENAQKGLSTVHALSAQAATISSKTVGLIDSMVKRAIRGRQTMASASVPAQPAPYRLSSYPPSSSVSSEVHPPSYASSDSLKPPLPPRTPSPSSPATSCYNSPAKPPLPPRQELPSKYSRTPSPQPAPVPGTSTSGSPHRLPPFKTRYRLLLSADLILDTMDSSVKRIVSVGGDNFARAVEHKYGPEAARSAGLVVGTTKNIVAVYIDMKGVGRRAIIRRIGKEYVKARLSNRLH
ncbi:hypothetical protein J3A83DRAFT_4099653 [Scleroderma citrinum]